MSATNNYRDTTDADILNKIRQQVESARAGITSQSNLTPNYIVPEAETLDITDSVNVNPNVTSISETLDITDSVTNTNKTTGTFQVCDTFKLKLPFDGDSLDYSENNDNGTVSGTTVYVAGRKGQALKFNSAIPNYVTLTSTTNRNFERTNKFSFVFWIYPTSGTNKYIYDTRSGSTSAGIAILINSTNILIVLEHGSSNLLEVSTASGTITLNAWNHVVFTYDGSSTPAGCKIYINTVSQSLTTVANSLSLTIQSGNAGFIGQFGGTGNAFDGYMDEIFVTNTVLTQNTINLMYAGSPLVSNDNTSVTTPAFCDFADCG